MKNSILFSGVGLSLLTPTLSGDVEKPKDNRPHIILCMTDDQGWGDVSYNGHNELKTPELDKMSKAGVRFNRFYAASSVCSPTRGSVLTGRNPERFRCYDWGCDLPLAEQTIAEVLRDNGYTTAHFGKWHLGGLPNCGGGDNRSNTPERNGKSVDDRHPGNQGFDYFFTAANHYNISPEPLNKKKAVTDFENQRSPLCENSPKNMVETPKDVDTSIYLIQKFEEWLSKQPKDKPVFAVIWFSSPHLIHEALDKDTAQYKKYDKPGKIFKGGGKKSDYYGEMAGVDRAMGRLRKHLRQNNMAENTFLSFTSDNGPYAPGRTAGLRGQKNNFYEGGIRVPGLIEWPAKIKIPHTCDIPCGTVDYFPTILKVAGISLPKQPLDGIDIMPIIEQKIDKRPQPLFFGRRNMRSDAPQVNVIMDNRYKLISRPNRLELYDLLKDPNEKKDISANNPELTQSLKKNLATWQKSVEKDISTYK